MPVRPALLRPLVRLDADDRRLRGESPQPAEYLARFPALDPAWLAANLADNHSPTDTAPDPAATADAFFSRLEASHLLSKTELEAIRQDLGGRRFSDAGELARLLVAREVLTAFQGRSLSEVVLGEYALLDVLGAGGMGTVYRAMHLRMKRVVAVKVLRGGGAIPEWCARPQEAGEMDLLPARLRVILGAGLQPVRGGLVVGPAGIMRSASRSWYHPKTNLFGFCVLQEIPGPARAVRPRDSGAR